MHDRFYLAYSIDIVVTLDLHDTCTSRPICQAMTRDRVVVPVFRTRRCWSGSPGLESRWRVWTLSVFVLLLCWCPGVIVGLPTNRGESSDIVPPIRERRQIIGDNVHTYLMSFGYLPQSDQETGNLRTDEQLKDALRTLQTFGNIPATGKLDSATLQLLKKPRCGLPDISTTHYRNKRYTLNGQKWYHNNLTWSLQTTDFKKLEKGHVRAELHRALDVWAQHSKLTFREVRGDSADILVSFHTRYHGDGYAFDGPGQILAHAFFPGTGRGGDAHFDEDETWLLNHQEDSEGTSLFAVAAHEFGHSLGLSHSSVEGALMFPWYQGLKPNFQLPDDDRHGIQQIYGAKDSKLWGKIPPYNPGVVATTPRYPPPPRTTHAPRVRPTYTPRTPTKLPPKSPGKPDTCDTSYDAVSIIRGDVFIFKGRYVWRVGNAGLYDGYPAEIERLWHDLPKNLTRIDAAYERLDSKIVFFIGRHYYLYSSNKLERGYPRLLTALGLPEEVERVDAAMVWGHNKKTYFFSGTMYWRFDEDVGKAELDYPRDMSMWKGVGYNIDAVFQWKDGKTYFFKGKGYWKFNDLRMHVENEKQSLSAPFWMGCPRELEEPITANDSGLKLTQSLADDIRSSIVVVTLMIAILSCLH